MQPCACCSASRETAGLYPHFDPACVYCGGRLIAKLTQRQRQVLADWTAQGHRESELRELAKAPESLQPIENRQIRPPDIGRKTKGKV